MFQFSPADTTNYLRSLPPIVFSGWEPFLGAVLGVAVISLIMAIIRQSACDYMLTVPEYKKGADKFPHLHPCFTAALSFLMCFMYGFDMLSMLLPPRPTMLIGVIISASVVARGPEAAIAMWKTLVKGAKEIKDTVDDAKKEKDA